MVCLYANSSLVMLKRVTATEGHRLHVCAWEWAEHMKDIYHMLSPDPEGRPVLATGPPQVC